MMNKGLEVIEACWLFNDPAGAHPGGGASAERDPFAGAYVDGSVLAQLGNPDMRTPIAHALAWPERIAAGVAPLDLFAGRPARLRAARFRAFSLPALAYEAAARRRYRARPC